MSRLKDIVFGVLQEKLAQPTVIPRSSRALSHEPHFPRLDDKDVEFSPLPEGMMTDENGEPMEGQMPPEEDDIISQLAFALAGNGQPPMLGDGTEDTPVSESETEVIDPLGDRVV